MKPLETDLAALTFVERENVLAAAWKTLAIDESVNETERGYLRELRLVLGLPPSLPRRIRRGDLRDVLHVSLPDRPEARRVFFAAVVGAVAADRRLGATEHELILYLARLLGIDDEHVWWRLRSVQWVETPASSGPPLPATSPPPPKRASSPETAPAPAPSTGANAEPDLNDLLATLGSRRSGESRPPEAARIAESPGLLTLDAAERRTVLAAVFRVVATDSHVNPAEALLLYDLCRHLDLPDGTVFDLAREAGQGTLDIPVPLRVETRRAILSAIMAAADADGELSREEMDLICDLARALNLDPDKVEWDLRSREQLRQWHASSRERGAPSSPLWEPATPRPGTAAPPPAASPPSPPDLSAAQREINFALGAIARRRRKTGRRMRGTLPAPTECSWHRPPRAAHSPSRGWPLAAWLAGVAGLSCLAAALASGRDAIRLTRAAAEVALPPAPPLPTEEPAERERRERREQARRLSADHAAEDAAIARSKTYLGLLFAGGFLAFAGFSFRRRAAPFSPMNIVAPSWFWKAASVYWIAFAASFIVWPLHPVAYGFLGMAGAVFVLLVWDGIIPCPRRHPPP